MDLSILIIITLICIVLLLLMYRDIENLKKERDQVLKELDDLIMMIDQKE